MDLRITGKRALITGGSGGFGKETARILMEEGAEVTLTDVDADALQDAASDLGANAHAADLSTVDGVAELVAAVGTGFDIWVHAAGITGDKGDPLEMDEEAWQKALDIDFMSGVRLARHLCPEMIARGWGRVVFVTSENVAQPYPEETVYNASKSALLSFAKSVAMQHSGSGLLVNSIAPAFIESPMTDGMMEQRAEARDESFDEAIDSFLEEERPYLVLGRRGKVEEVAPVIAMLCSERASFVTGANWRVDGGAVGAINI